jgi:hypothetical protein
MLKRIAIDQLRLGMYIHELGSSWMDNPFWRGAFLLEDPKDLQTIISTRIQSAWIDTSKGDDIEGGETEETVTKNIETAIAPANTPPPKDRATCQHHRRSCACRQDLCAVQASRRFHV